MRRAACAALAFLACACVARTQTVYEAAAPVPAAPESSAAASDPISVAIASPDRSEEDRALDEGRHPAELLAFAGLAPGMRVGELGAGGGYTTELLARVVGPGGIVYAQNDPWVLQNIVGGALAARLEKPAMTNVAHLERPFDDPFPPELSMLDAVVMVLFYHDTVGLNVDRDKMNRAVYAALKPGGIYCVVDHSTWPGRGTSEASTLHRIDERLVRNEIERVGFELDDQAFFLRNPDDTRDWSASPRDAGERRGTSDRFVLKFIKPVSAPELTP